METPVDKVEVPFDQLEQTLQRTWASDGLDTLVRACASNLVVIMWDLPATAAIREAVARVTETYPARTILVEASPQHSEQPERGLRSWVAYRCQGRVCHEEISVALQGHSVQYLDTVVFSVLVADLPRFLWWSGSLPEGGDMQRTVGQLIEQCDRLMIDTGQMREPSVDLVALSHLTRHEPGAAVGDLNWHRFAAWRRLLAQSFDPPDMRPRLDAIESGRILWRSPGPTVPVQVLLYLGWLASSLGWTLANGRRNGFVFERQGREIPFELVPQSGRDTSLVEVDIMAPEAQVRLRRIEQSLESTVRSSGRPETVVAVPAPELDLAAVLQSELAILGRNPGYERALHMAERLARHS